MEEFMKKHAVNSEMLASACRDGAEKLRKQEEEEKKRIAAIERYKKRLETRLRAELPVIINEYSITDRVYFPTCAYLDCPDDEINEVFPNFPNQFSGLFHFLLSVYSIISAIVTVINLAGSVKYWVHKPSTRIGDIREDEDWQDNCLHSGINDYTIALALAKRAKKDSRSSEAAPAAAVPDPRAVVYEPMDDDPAVNQYQSALERAIDERLRFHNLI